MGLASRIAATQANGRVSPVGSYRNEVTGGPHQGQQPPNGDEAHKGDPPSAMYPPAPNIGGDKGELYQTSQEQIAPPPYTLDCGSTSQPQSHFRQYPPQSFEAPSQRQYGSLVPPPRQGGYGGGNFTRQTVQATDDFNAYRRILQETIHEKNLVGFYPPGSPQIDQIAQDAARKVNYFCTTWRIPFEIGQDVVKLALFDTILYVDDSGSMRIEEDGERIDDLKLILQRAAFATSLFDTDGIQVRFMNSSIQGNDIKDEKQVERLISQIDFSGMTPMGRELNNKILQPLVIRPARAKKLKKPVSVIIITDGHPTGEDHGHAKWVMLQASQELQKIPCYGKGALSFQFAQVGNDLKARKYLGTLDEDPEIGDIIDCTSNYEVEADEMKNAVPPIDLSPELWLMKLLLGSIDSSYDTKDEKGQRASR